MQNDQTAQNWREGYAGGEKGLRYFTTIFSIMLSCSFVIDLFTYTKLTIQPAYIGSQEPIVEFSEKLQADC